jgi:hypothetical protein
MLKNHYLQKISYLGLGLLIACQEDIPTNTSKPTIPQGDFRIGDFASLRIEDMRPNYDFYLLDIQAPTPDMQIATPDMQIATPDMQIATPDMQIATPDMQIATPDMQVAIPDMQVANPDMQAPTPDMLLIDMDIHNDHDHGPMDASVGENIDLTNFNVTCVDAMAYRNALPMCAAGSSRTTAIVGFNHIADQTPITYNQNPPSSGDHRSIWAKYGEYTRLPPQRWLHNLEHGAIVFLYHPCAPTEQIDQLRQIARAQANDTNPDAPFRWILTPYPDLASSIAVVAWGVDYQANCINQTEIQDFINTNYRRGREDISSDGLYQTEWIGR